MSDGTAYSEEDFYRHRREMDRRRAWAVNGAIFLHVAVVAGALYLPGLAHRRPLLDEVMTIDLVSLPEQTTPPVEARPAPQKTPEPAPKPAPEPPPPAPKKAVPLEVAKPEPAPEPAPEVKARPVSLKPLKRKIRKAKDTRLDEEKEAQRRAAELKRQKRAREEARKKALAEARREEARAREAARRARAELAAVLREQQNLHTSPSRKGGSRSGQVNSAIEKQYYMDLARRVQRLWVLPEIKKWSPSLETVIEFTVLPDGRLTNVKVARSSGDVFFDRFARDTVRKAAPMPPFPAVLRKPRLDLGFRLRPAGIQR